MLYAALGLLCAPLFGPLAVFEGLRALWAIHRDQLEVGLARALAGLAVGMIETGLVLSLVAFLQQFPVSDE